MDFKQRDLLKEDVSINQVQEQIPRLDFRKRNVPGPDFPIPTFPTDIIIPVPNVPGLPPLPGGSNFPFKWKRRSRVIRRTTKAPSAFALEFNITGEITRRTTLTGIGIRPGKKNVNLFKMSVPRLKKRKKRRRTKKG